MNKIEGAQCANCPLRDRPFVPGHGPTDPELVVVGEAPGYAEAREGVPFVGPSGKLLRQALAFHGVSDVYITNVVKCHPKGNKLPQAAVKCCRLATVNEIEEFDAPVLACGNVASEAYFGDPVKKVRPYGYAAMGKTDVATWHPAYILRVPQRLHARTRREISRRSRPIFSTRRTTRAN